MLSSTDLELQLLIEAELPPMGKKRAVVIIGRMNPPTAGHYKVIDSAKKYIRTNPDKNLIATPVLVIIGDDTKERDLSKNPLSVEDRIRFIKASGKANGVIILSAPNAFAALVLAREKGYEPIVIAVGSDRADSYMKILKSFKDDEGNEIEHFQLTLDRNQSASLSPKQKKAEAERALELVKDTGGEIDTDLVSGSLAKTAVEMGYFDEFVKIVGLENNQKLAELLWDKLKSAHDKMKAV